METKYVPVEILQFVFVKNISTYMNNLPFVFILCGFNTCQRIHQLIERFLYN